jgi:imidazolonepropionase-like amidohydrolase
MRNAVEAGVDCIEHGYFYIAEQATEYVHDGVPSGVMEYRSRYDGSITEAMLARDMYLSATLPAGGYRELLDLRERSRNSEQLTATEHARREGLERRFERKHATLQRLRADGLTDRILITTDAGPLRTEFGRFSDAIIAAVESGLDVEQALAAVTRIPAEACGRHDIGTLTVGKQADIVILNGDPRRSLDHLQAPAAVFMQGARVTPFEAVVAPSWM